MPFTSYPPNNSLTRGLNIVMVTEKKENPRFTVGGFEDLATEPPHLGINVTSSIGIRSSESIEKSLFSGVNILANDNGYIRIPRSLLNDPRIIGAPSAYLRVFLQILNYAAFEPREYNDHGVILKIEVGQAVFSMRQFAELCGPEISKDQVHRAIKYLIKFNFVRQEVRHRKTVITITHSDTYELILESGATRSATRPRQDRDTKENYKNISSLRSDRKKKKINKKESLDSELAKWAFEQYRTVCPNAKEPDWAVWNKNYQAIIEQDGKTPEQVKAVVTWIVETWTDQFCPQSALRHPSRMREKFEDYLGRQGQRKSLRPEGFAAYSKNSAIQEMARTIQIIE
jgi:hypothetical protein